MAHPTEVLVTAEEVRRLFRYDPDTGEMTRRVTLCGRALAGQRVGTRKAWGHLSEEAHAAYVERRNRLLPNCAI